MNEEFVNYEIAIKLNEKGFNLKTRYGYLPPIKLIHESFIDRDWVELNGCPAPTISQALKWLREKHNILISPSVYGNEDGRIWSYSIINIEIQYLHGEIPDNVESYEQAALAGINHVLNNLI